MTAAVVHTCARLPFQNVLRSCVYSTSRTRYLPFLCTSLLLVPVFIPPGDCERRPSNFYTLNSNAARELHLKAKGATVCGFVALDVTISPSRVLQTQTRHSHPGGEHLNEPITICKSCWRCINSTAFPAFTDLSCSLIYFLVNERNQAAPL